VRQSKTRYPKAATDSGFTLAEFVAVIAVLVVILAIAVPRFLSEQDRAYTSVARADARSLSQTVTYALLQVRDFGEEPALIQLVGPENNQEVTIRSSAPEQPPVTVGVRLTPGSELAVGEFNNTATNQTDFCVAVAYQGRVAYQTLQGPVSSCEPGAPLLAPSETDSTGAGTFATPPTFVKAEGLTEGSWIKSAHGLSGWVTLSPGTKKVAVSANGDKWQTFPNLPVEANWSSIEYGAGVYVALAENNNSSIYAVSKDGFSWTEIISPEGGGWRDIVYGDNRFIAVKTNAVAVSSDGVQWTVQSMLPGSWKHVVYGDGKYIAIQEGTTNVAAYSENGVEWVTANLPSPQRWSALAYGDGQFIMVAENATESAAISTNGTKWTLTAELPTGQSYGAIGYSNGMWVAVSNGTAFAYTSTDGLSWTPRAMSDRGTWTGLTPINGVWVLTSTSDVALVGI